MVRNVLADETNLEAHVNKIFRNRTTSEVGLLLGKRGTTRDLVYSLIPTPSKDGDGPPNAPATSSSSQGGKKGGKGKGAAEAAPLVLDEDWIVEHARQASRMLVGGVQVVGLYAFCPDASFRHATPSLLQAVKGVASVIATHASPASSATDLQHSLLLHICPTPKKYSFKSCVMSSSSSSTSGTAAAQPSSLPPCDLKWGNLLAGLHCFTCRYPVAADSSLPAGSTRDPPHVVELLLPRVPQELHPPDEDERGDLAVAGMVSISGPIHARAYAHAREPYSRAMADLKADIVGSLEARLALLVDEAELALEESVLQEEEEDELPEASPSHLHAQRHSQQQQASTRASGRGGSANARPPPPPLHPLLATGRETDGWGLARPYACGMPRRVLVPWGSAGGHLCDYLSPTEPLEESMERCKAMLALDIGDETSLIEVESAAVVNLTVLPKHWDPIADLIKGSQKAGPGASSSVAGSEGTLKSAADTKASYNLYLIAFLFGILILGVIWLLTGAGNLKQEPVERVQTELK
eukprot:jgi/Mesen1/2436/ME000157S01578